MFFIYDHTVLQKEEDDLKDAIIYFDPPSTSVETQCAICGQLMGMVLLCKSLMGSHPTLYKLQKQKFAVKCLGKFTIALAGNGVDDMLRNQLDSLYSLFIFYQNSIVQYYKDGCNPAEQVWASYVQFIRHYGNKVTASFKSLPFIEIPQPQQKGELIVQHSTHLLQYCTQHYPVFAGCILFRNSVLCTEFSADFTFRLLMIGPQTNSQVFQVKQFNEPLPDGVKIVPVYLTANEYRNFSRNLHIHPNYCVKQTKESQTYKKPAEKYTEKHVLENKESVHVNDGSLGHNQNNDSNCDAQIEFKNTKDFSDSKRLMLQEKGVVSQNILSDPTEIMKNIKSVAARSSSVASLKIEQAARKSWGMDNLCHSVESNVAVRTDNTLPPSENTVSHKDNSSVKQEQTIASGFPLNNEIHPEHSLGVISEGNRSMTTDQSFSILSKEDLESSTSSDCNEKIIEIPDCSVVSVSSTNVHKTENSPKHTDRHENKDSTLVYERKGLVDKKLLYKVDSESSKYINPDISCVSGDSDHHHCPKESENIIHGKGDNHKSDEMKFISASETEEPAIKDDKNKEDDVSGLGSKEISWTDFVKYEDEESVAVDLYVQSNSEMLIVLLMEKTDSNSNEIVENMWKKILPELAQLEGELQMSLQKPQPKKSNEALSYNYLQFNGFRQSLSGKIAISENKLEPISADESHFCETAVMLHNMYSTHPHLKDVTLRNSRSVIYGHNMMKHETFFQKVLSRAGSDAPSEKDTTLLIERRAKERLQKDQGITIV